MNINQYIAIRNNIDLLTVSLGYREIKIFSSDDLEHAQIGFSLGTDGKSLTGSQKGDWKDSWLVIAKEDLLGDPLFVDLNDQELPVYTASIGEGFWKPVMIASSFNGFVRSLEEINKIAQGRNNPVRLASNPLTEKEKQQVIQKILSYNKNISLEFWEDWFEV